MGGIEGVMNFVLVLVLLIERNNSLPKWLVREIEQAGTSVDVKSMDGNSFQSNNILIN